MCPFAQLWSSSSMRNRKMPMMGWKKRSRRWRGVSPLSALSVSCGIIFVMGNLYILHSGFSQAYRDLGAADADNGGLEAERGQPASGGAFGEAGVLQGLPLLALEAVGYIAGRGLGRQNGAAGNVLDIGVLQSQNDGMRGFGDARLRKLMGNRRDWGSEVQQSLQHKAQLRQQQQLPKQSHHPVENTGRKQRTSVQLAETQYNSHLKATAHQGSHSNIMQDQERVLYYEPGNGHAPPGIKDLDRGGSVVGMGQGHPTSKGVADVPAAELRRLLMAGSRCGYVRSLAGREYVGSGWTKAVYRAEDPGRGIPVAVKTVDLAGHDMATCGQKPGMGPISCYNAASQKLLKEMLLLQSFNQQHIIKMLGYCVPQKPYDGDADSLVAMVTELGETIDIIKLLQMSWEDRLRVSYGVTRLLKYLADSPFGSVSLNDFRRQQFVLVRGDVTLTDLDDVGFQEPSCVVADDCIHYFSSTNFTLRSPCIEGQCVGFNEKKNIFNAARHFTTFLLPHGAPPTLRPAIDAIIHAYSNATLRAGQLLEMLDRVVERYRKGEYIQRSPEEKINRYTVRNDADLPGLFDYRCRFSIASGCTLSVLDQREAEQLCDLDLECKAFVISNQQTWTGRMIVHLKNNITSPSSSPGMSLCVKPGL